ncbi:conserved hypothetical protein [Culex quinquefasciatus]|uniref:Ribosomal protein S6 kinase delta-1 n=1 Tax=Culex quinquefasciatus TaxID=7176 RepID=B0X4C2_CULQU|nr:conserved hypothetical protein [Culex quinquefasciatus]|eukprot:XP_001864494.1 conserved hypothetical protein [Culex quinquefasciatus]
MEPVKKIPDWVHSFSVSETRKHKGYTIYRITSIVFPRYLPEALSSVTLWKRFSDVKQLYKDLVRRHRDRHLPGTVPELAERTYFKRFDARIIEERRQYVLRLLEFAGREPVLYQSYAFVKFFERGISPEGSPQKGAGGNIAEICGNLAIPVPDEIVLIDPSRDDGEVGSGGEDDVVSVGGSMVDSMLSQSSSAQSGGEPVSGVLEEPVDEVDSLDYIVEAAMVFSRAAQAEANGRYKEAFDEYKAGIDRLLTGAKTDANAARKKMAKEKTCKYVTRAEEIYEKYLLHQEDDAILQLSPICLDDPSSPIQLLERPLNYLSRYKVVRVLEGRVMQVQDVTDRKFYVMKGIRKPAGGFSQASSLPYNVPYMVPLVAYFQSESSVFLLLKLVAGGKLWDYIASYRKSDEFTPPTSEDSAEQGNVDHTPPPTYIPSFDALSKDMDVSDLVSCSQQLLRAVSQTIEQSDQQQPRNDLLEREGGKLLAAAVPKRPHIDTSQLELRTAAEKAAQPDQLPEGCVKQWISELIIAVDNLHFNGIVCGDLTMDNLLLGPEGQLLLTYFYRKERFPDAATLATELRPEAVQQLYVAPERPLQPCSDYWSIGVILFEMLTRRSFLACHPAGVFCYLDVQYPDAVDISDEARQLLDGLLQPLPENRFDFKEIIASAFFHTIDWSEVKRRGQQSA